MAQNLLEIIQKFKSKNIMVIGDAMLDEYLFGRAERISPEAPIPILRVEKILHSPGGAANTAYNVKGLGANVFFVGVVGNDEKGKVLTDDLKAKAIDVSGLMIDQQRKTTVKTRALAMNQQMLRIDQEETNSISPEMQNKVLGFVQEHLKDLQAIILSDYAKGVLTFELTQKIIGLSKENKVLCLVDPKGDDASKYKNCDVITPNFKELGQMIRLEIKNQGQFMQASQALMSCINCSKLVVTQGEQGMTFFSNTQNVNRPALNKEPRDVSGAGDTAIASFALGFSCGATPEEVLDIASLACAIKVNKIGASPVFSDELIEAINKETFQHESTKN